MDKKDNKAKYHKMVQNNFNAPIYHYYEYIENNYADNAPQGEEETFPQLPTTDQMKQAVMATVAQGFWWSMGGGVSRLSDEGLYEWLYPVCPRGE